MGKNTKSINWKTLIFAILLCQGAGLIGSIFTFDAIPTWYATLTKPSFSPPNFLFGPVWTTLYTLMGISLYLLWKAKKSTAQAKALSYFYIQLFLNTIWSIIFFGFKNPELALIEIILMWLAIVATMIKAYSVDKRATYLLIPYILWVSFATMLNAAIALLN
jgi:tryptophan-rich sensory protein